MMDIQNLSTHNANAQYWVNLWYRMLRCLAVALISVFAAWQVFWLSSGQLPPALFLAITGLPAPTTGGTRSLICLLRGDWVGSLHHNAMAVPITLLAISCVTLVITQAIRGRPARLSRHTGIAWLVVLGLAWSIKLLQVLFFSPSFNS